MIELLYELDFRALHGLWTCSDQSEDRGQVLWDTLYVLSYDATQHMCCSSARQCHAFDEGIVAWRVISKQILLRV
jgi:hypothetical protein